MLFVLAIEKSNIEADLIQIELPGSEIDFVRTQIRNRGDNLSDAYQKQGRHIQHIIKMYLNCLSYYLITS